LINKSTKFKKGYFMYKTIFSTLLLLATYENAKAFDLGSAINAVSPVAQSVAPLADSALNSNPLVSKISSTLGVTPTQAVGGTAAILSSAKSNMSSKDYGSLIKQMPQLDAILSAAPSKLLNSGSLTSKFNVLGLDASMVSKFTPLVMQYIQSGTKPGTADLVMAALSK
jgi:hypothetical protein